MSDSVRPHRWQPTRLRCPWHSPGKNTGVGCHFLLQCMKVKSQSEVAQLCPTLSDPMDCSSPGFSIHGILQARVLEWAAIAFSTRWASGKEPTCQCRRHKRHGFDPLGWEDSPGEGHGNPLQDSCLENPVDRGATVSYSLWGPKESDTTAAT